MQPVKDERSLGELFAELSRDTGTLLRQEVALAKAEMTQKVTRAGRQVAFIAAGGALAYTGLLAIMAAVIILLSGLGLPWWASALVVGLALAGLGYALVQKGLTTLRREGVAPHQTIESVKENAEWVKGQTK
jgi:hypothetical protein